MKDNSRTIVSPYRNWEIPAHNWSFFQEWNDVLFMHWEVPFDFLQELVPDELEIDLYEGKSYVSLVAFHMQKLKPNGLPSLKLISDFLEINLRTYVVKDGKKGVYFLNIEASKRISSFLARKISGLPYEKSDISRDKKGYHSFFKKKHFSFDTQFKTGENIIHKSSLEIWLTERYCLYLKDFEKIIRYEIQHEEWKIQSVLPICDFKINYQINGMILNYNNLHSMHYSKGVQVYSWKKESLQY